MSKGARSRACVARAARLLSLALLAPAAHAQTHDDGPLPEVSVDATSTTRMEALADNGNARSDDDGYLLLQQRLDAAATWGELELLSRIDADGFMNAPTPAYANNLSFERLSLRWRTESVPLFDVVAITGGDFSAQLGKGVALAVRRVPEVGVDASVRGARLDVDNDALALIALAGVFNPANVDALSRQHIDDPGDVLSGAQLTLHPHFGLAVGALASVVVPSEKLLPDHADWTATAGAFIDARVLDVLDVGLEVDAQQRTVAGVLDQGAAAVLELQADAGPAVLAFDALWLSGMEVRGSRNSATGARFDYSQPPTLERIDQEVPNSRDVLGARARLDVTLPIGATLFGSAMVRAHDLDTPSPLHHAHAFFGADLTPGSSRVQLAGGAREELVGAKLVALRSMQHVDADAVLDVGRGFAVHSATTMQLWRAGERRFVRGSSLLGLSHGGDGEIAVDLGIDTQDPSPHTDKLFLAAVVSYHVTSSLTVSATAGSQRGGVRCVGGVCRELPPFAGAKAELSLRL